MEFVGFKMIFIVVLFLMRSVVDSKESSEFKLPTNFNPVSYRLDVTTYLDDQFIFEGVVDIQVSLYSRDIGHINYLITMLRFIKKVVSRFYFKIKQNM